MIFKKKIKKKIKKNCSTCRFNYGLGCSVGTFYAKERGVNAVCIEGELWEGKK
jgi:hypothetical protein